MASNYAGLNGSFAAQIREFAEQAQGALNTTVREVVIEIGTSVVRMSPVGDPELWAENAIAKQYNDEVARHNSALRADPANLTKAGRLRPGRKANDSMEVKAAEGYVGGRFRGNWHISLDVIEDVTFDEPDPSGAGTIAAMVAAMGDFKAGQIAYILNNLPYAVPLEYGHSTQAPAGMVRITIERFQQIVDEAARNNQV